MSTDAVHPLLATYATNQRITEYLIRGMPDAAWRAVPPGGKGRDIASIAAHIHNVRLMWIKSAKKAEPLSPKLDGETVTREAAVIHLQESWRELDRIVKESLAAGGQIRGFKPDVSHFVGYLIAHDSHHRGQMSMLARQTGHPLPKPVMFGLWEWGTR